MISSVWVPISNQLSPSKTVKHPISQLPPSRQKPSSQYITVQQEVTHAPNNLMVKSQTVKLGYVGLNLTWSIRSLKIADIPCWQVPTSTKYRSNNISWLYSITWQS